MNVLLAEANVYEQLVEMDDINPLWKIDVAIVIGANDVRAHPSGQNQSCRPFCKTSCASGESASKPSRNLL